MNFKKVALISSVVASVFVLSACSKYGTSTNSTSSQTGSSATGQAQSGTSQDSQVVTITDSGFSPAEVTVKSGGKVTWTNSSTNNAQVASDPHPTHTGNSEVSGGQFVLDLVPGASSTVTLTKTGTWGVHDHLNPGSKMKLTVQ